MGTKEPDAVDELGKRFAGPEIRRRMAAQRISLRDLEGLSGVEKSAIKRILDGGQGKPHRVAAIARALGCTVHDLEYPDLAPSEESSGGGRAGLVRSIPVDSGVRSDGSVFGRITYDVIKDPTGKGGMVLRLGHSRRGKRKAVEYRELTGVHPDDAVVFVSERVDVYAADGRIDDVLKPGTALLVSATTPPKPGDLVLVAKNIDWSAQIEPGSDEGLAGVHLMRYLEIEVDGVRLPHGWPLDGREGGQVRIGGFFSVVGVVVGRLIGRPGGAR